MADVDNTGRRGPGLVLCAALLACAAASVLVQGSHSPEAPLAAMSASDLDPSGFEVRPAVADPQVAMSHSEPDLAVVMSTFAPQAAAMAVRAPAETPGERAVRIERAIEADLGNSPLTSNPAH